jgi:hypothetical protein
MSTHAAENVRTAETCPVQIKTDTGLRREFLLLFHGTFSQATSDFTEALPVLILHGLLPFSAYLVHDPTACPKPASYYVHALCS